jgi:hypothetical protein
MRYFPITCTHKKSGISTLALMFFVACQNAPMKSGATTFDDSGLNLNPSENLPQDITPFLEASKTEDTPEVLQLYPAEELINDSNAVSLAIMNLKANHGVQFVEGPFKIVKDEDGNSKTIEELELDEVAMMNHIQSKVIDTGSTVYEIRHEIKNQMNVVFSHVQAFNKKYTEFPYVLELGNGTKKPINSPSDLPKELKSHLQDNGRYVSYIHMARVKLMSLKFPQDESGQPVTTAKPVVY